jgi:tetratricopeptide (TPR) repeat protein
MSGYPYDLGTHSRPVTTASAEAQMWFDRGLVWTYGFHHAEAIACFRRAIDADPACAMAWWGVAYALGPNYNLTWDHMDGPTRAAVLSEARAATEAAQAAPGADAAERALIRALDARYPQADPVEDMTPWNDAYADAMRAVFAAHPDDLDIAALFVEAMMDRTPWKMWDLSTSGPAPGADTEEARRVLEAAFRRDAAAWCHPGLLHLYVHLMEMSPFPEKALRQADVLRTLVPDAGHLVHMASHIDVLVGAYSDVLRSNLAAIAADRKWYDREGGMDFYTAYRQHDYHFVVYGAMFLGQFAPALAAADELVATTPEALLRMPSPPMADYMESYLAMRPHVFIRFGKWHELVAEPFPHDADLYANLTATLHYAKGVACAALGRVAEAEEEQRLFQEALARVPETRLLHNNRCVDLLEIAAEMLAGEIAYRKGDHDRAFAHLRRSVALDDALPYDEPWGWMQPTRHALGALLLEQGRTEEAEAVYREDLGLGGGLPRSSIHPDNVWSLKGLHDCLIRQHKLAEAAMIKPRLDVAMARADISVGASCFCARAAAK